MNLVRENRKGEMKTLLDQGADVNGTQYSWTFLHQAAYCGHLNMARLLFRHGIELDTTDYKRRTAKDVAIRYGNTHIADAIDDEVAYRRNPGSSPRIETTQTEEPSRKKTRHEKLFEVGGPPPAHTLMGKVRMNCVDEVDVALQLGSNVNGMDIGWTFLHQVAFCGHLDMARLLFRHGIELDAKDYLQRTPKEVAIRYGRTHIADAIDTEMAHRLMNERVTTPQATSGSTSKKAGGACAQGHRRNLHASSCRTVE